MQRDQNLSYVERKVIEKIPIDNNVLDQEKVEYFAKNLQYITYEDLQAIVERKKAA